MEEEAWATSENALMVRFWTDGACKGNPGPMGAGIVGLCGTERREWSIPLGHGTNNQAELMAVREALLTLPDRSQAQVRIDTDSEYVVGMLTKGWRAQKNGALIGELRKLLRECRSYSIKWVKGHDGWSENERADELAVQAIEEGMSE